jgi:hypothetical protein
MSVAVDARPIVVVRWDKDFQKACSLTTMSCSPARVISVPLSRSSAT